MSRTDNFKKGLRRPRAGSALATLRWMFIIMEKIFAAKTNNPRKHVLLEAKK